MKKIAFILAVLMIASALPLAANASPTNIIENDTVVMNNASPVIDGVIDPGEGWSDPAFFDYDTVAHFWRFLAQTTDIKLYFAYSDDGLYFGAEVTENSHRMALDQNGNMSVYDGNSFIVSTDMDLNENGRVTDYGFNGDVLTLTLDPDRTVYRYARRGDRAVPPFYDIAIFRDSDGREYPRVYRSVIHAGEITDLVTVAARRTEKGWDAELLLPWEMIADDINMLASYRDDDYTVGELREEGTELYAAAIYMDRYFDDELGTVQTWGRYMTVCDVCPDNSKGYAASGPCAKNLGIKLLYQHDFAAGRTLSEPTCTANGKMVFACRDCGVESFKKIPALGHELTLVETLKEATCTEPGYAVYHCSRCDKDVEQKIDALGHEWGAWTEIVPADPGKDGTERRVCGRCGEAEERAVEWEFSAAGAYIDVRAGSWYEKGVSFCVNRGYMTGTRKSMFSPEMDFSRAMFVTVLAKIDGADLSAYKGSSYSDVPEGKWFSAAVEWASRMGYASGMGDGIFAPDASVTREQLATFLHTYAAKKGADVSAHAYLGAYSDGDTVSKYARNALSWAIANGLITGTTADTISPKGVATRAQVAVIVRNFVLNVLDPDSKQ